jgi:hypothetical protein
VSLRCGRLSKACRDYCSALLIAAGLTATRSRERRA